MPQQLNPNRKDSLPKAGDTSHVSVVGGSGDTAIKKTYAPPAFRFSDNDTTTATTNIYEVAPDTFRLFTGHELSQKSSGPVTFNRRTNDWFTVILFLVMVGFTWIRAFYFKIFKQLIAAFFSNTVTNQVVRDENILIQRASVLMSFIFYLTASLFLYQVSVYYKWDYKFMGDGVVRFLIMALIVAFAYSSKLVILKGLSSIFRLDRPVATYIFNIFLINNMLGVILIPVVVTIAYVVTGSIGIVINTGVVLVIIAFIYRLVRAFSIWLTLQGVSLFYLILYFCTLEIAPLLIVIKLAKG